MKIFLEPAVFAGLRFFDMKIFLEPAVFAGLLILLQARLGN